MHQKKLAGIAITSLMCFFVLVVTLLSYNSLYQTLVHFDSGVEHMVAPLRASKDLAQFMLAMTYLGNPEIIIVFEICLLALIVLLHRKRIAGLFLAGIIAGEVASLFFKNLLARMRPPEMLFHISRVGYSFPSGHALLGTLFYGTLGFFLAHMLHKRWQRIAVAVGTVCIIFLIGCSRIYLGVHYATDVVGGWLLGVTFLSLVAMSFVKIHHHLKSESLASLSRSERAGLIVVSFMLGFFLLFFQGLSEIIKRIAVLEGLKVELAQYERPDQ